LARQVTEEDGGGLTMSTLIALVIKGAPERTVELARRAAQNRGVTDRLEIG
jgi:hypothetical protein